MDQAIDKNGDLALRFGTPCMIGGTEELLQRAYICLAVRKGSFIYDRELGSNFRDTDLSLPDAAAQLESKAREALGGIAGAEVTAASLSGDVVAVMLRLGNTEHEIEVIMHHMD